MTRLHKTLRTGATALLAGTILASVSAVAAEAADLREKLSVTDNVVKLSDLFTDTGEAGETIIMEAPAPGGRKQLSSYDLVRIAKEHKLDWERPSYLKRVYVHREGVAFKLADLEPAFMERLRDEGMDGDYDIRVFGKKIGLYVPAGYSVQDIAIETFSLSANKNRFQAILHVPSGTSEPMELRVTGSVEETRLIPALNRVITPGEVIGKADVEWIKFPAKRINRNTVLASSDIVGQTVRRPLQPGKMIRGNDIKFPVAVEKNSIVFVTYRRGPLTLSMQARALEDGGIGDTIRLMNQKSKKTVFAVVRSEDQVEVMTAPTLKLASR